MALYRFLFAPALLAVAVLAGRAERAVAGRPPAAIVSPAATRPTPAPARANAAVSAVARAAPAPVTRAERVRSRPAR